MIEQTTSLELVRESIRKKWETKKEIDKGLVYPEGVRCWTAENADDVRKIRDWLLADPKALIGFDTEATSNRPDSAGIVGMSFAIDEREGFYVPTGHVYGQNVDEAEALEILAPVFAARLSMAGGKFDWHLMRRHGAEVRWGADSQSMSRLLGEVEYGVGLKPTVARMFGERMIEFSDVVTPSARAKGESFAHQEIGEASLYAIPDAINTRRVSLYAMAHMPEAIKSFLLRVEHDVMEIAGEMEWVGLPVDMEFLERHIEAGTAMADTLRVEAIEGLKAVAVRRGRKASEIPDDLNLDSAPQMQKALFDVCGFPVIQKSKKTGKPSASKQVIEKLAESEPEVDWVRRWRSCSSRVGDLKELRDFAVERDGWWYTSASLTPTGTATGRWSSSGPNAQNIPKGVSRYESRNSVWEVAPRDAIKAPPGHYIVTADYSQIELRVAAGESQCRSWMDAFANGDDVHSASGAAVHGVPLAEVSKKQRADGKTFNFALLFGQEVKSTAQALGVSVAEAQRMQNNYWAGLPEVKSWIDSIHATVRKQKFVETKFGRRRWLRGIDDENKWVYLKNLRESVNTVVQGTAADILKIGLRRQRERSQELGARLFLVVHDQYVWIVPETTAPDVFCQAMDEVINFEIPGYPEMVSDYSIGHRFDSLVDFASAAEVPPTWAEVFEKPAAGTGVSDQEESLLIEVAEVGMAQLLEMTKLVTENPGGRPVLLTVTGAGIKEKPMLDGTSLGLEDELRIRAAIGNSARVTLV